MPGSWRIRSSGVSALVGHLTGLEHAVRAVVEAHLQPAAPVDLDGSPRGGIHDDGAAAEEVAGPEPLVERVEAAALPLRERALERRLEVRAQRSLLARNPVGASQ